LVVAEAIRTRVEAAQPEAAGARIRMSVSIGMAEHGKNNPVSETFKHADDLLFAAKRAGRNCVIGAQHKVLNIARVHKAAERRRHVRLYH
jgi:PleD family two-component response regulator